MDKVKRILPYAAYGAFYLVVFFVACYLTFPYARLRDRLVAEFAADAKGKPAQQRLEIDELEPYWLSGVRARGVRLTTAAPPKPVGPEDPPTVLALDEVRARMGIFARIFGKTKVSFYVKAFGGEIDGTWIDASTERHLDAELTGVEVTRIDPIVSLVGLPMYGAMTGKIDLTFPEKRFQKAEGTVKLTIADLAIGNGVAKLKGMLALPRMKVGDLVLDLEAKDGVMKVNKLAAAGDLEVAAEGKLGLRDEPGTSISDIYVRFKFSEGFKNRNDATKALFTGPLPAFELSPEIKSSKRADGFYGWHMTGPLAAAKFEPYAGVGPAPAAPTPGSRLGPAMRPGPGSGKN